MKIGFNLLPITLKGLGNITHLINIDMVEDLIPILKSILARNHPSSPIDIKLLCIHCVLKTISGPGAVLQVDDEIYLINLILIIPEIFSFQNFNSNVHILDTKKSLTNYWEIAFECVEIVLLKKRETRTNFILSFVKVLFLICVHMPDSSVGATALCLAHNVLIRYPRIRIDMKILSNKFVSKKNSTEISRHEEYIVEEDDEVADYAMKALKEHNNSFSSQDGISKNVIDDNLLVLNNSNTSASDTGDGSMILTLLRHHIDVKYNKVINAMTTPDIIPMPYRSNAMSDKTSISSDGGVGVKEDYEMLKRIDSSLSITPKSLPSNHNGSMNKGHKKNLNTVQSNKSKLNNGGLLSTLKTKFVPSR